MRVPAPRRDAEPFQWVMLWTNLLPTPVMAGLWANEFFPRWLQVLHVWLSHQPNYDEVTRWYQSWKAAFPPGLVAHPAITMQFNRYAGRAGTPTAIGGAC